MNQVSIFFRLVLSNSWLKKSTLSGSRSNFEHGQAPALHQTALRTLALCILVGGYTHLLLGPTSANAATSAETLHHPHPSTTGSVVGTDAKQSDDQPDTTGSTESSRRSELLQLQSDRLAYNGEILAEHRVTVVAEASGLALEVNVAIGQAVRAGDIILQIDSTVLEAQKEQAMTSLEVAQAQLELLLEETSPADLEAARASLASAQASYDRVLAGAQSEDVRIAESQLRQAQAAVSVAQSAYNEVKGNPRVGLMPQSLQLQNATLELEAAQARYDKVVRGASAEDIASAYAQLVNARNQLAKLEEGPKAAEVRIAEAQVKQAETGLFLAQLALDKATVRTPVDGVVAMVDVTAGSMVGNGSDVAVVLSPDVKVTIPVEEVRLSELAVGQPAVMRVDAYPDRLFEAEVTTIAPEFDPTTRTVKVTLRPGNDDMRHLRPGMFATVDLFNKE